MTGEPTLYVPERHSETDPAYIRGFLDTYPFAMAVTTAGGLLISHVPVLTAEPAAGDAPWGTLSWHIARGNPQSEALGPGGEVTLVFHGPHSYISPNWYRAAHAVPTWNFAAVHCTGQARRIDDDARLASLVARLTAVNESKYGGGERWSLDRMPEPYLAGLRRAITGYEMKIDRVEAKFKLGQERSPADRSGVLEALSQGKGAEKSLTELTAEYYLRRPAP